MEKFMRTEILIGSDGVKRLSQSRVMVFGVGGVGSYVVEALTRGGIGAIDIIDNDTVSESNINRQLVALSSTVGRLKVDAASERIYDINKDCKVRKYPLFVTADNLLELPINECDYVVDAIDNITAKIALAVYCEKANIPIISSMGTGNKLEPTLFKIADIYKTSVCPLAKVMRYELKRRGVKRLKVLYSEEMPSVNSRPPGSISFVPGSAGLIIAGEVIKDLLK